MDDSKKAWLSNLEYARRRTISGPYRGPNLDRSGPDGNGEDSRIKSPDDFNSCLGEIAARLSSLEVLVWACPAALLPSSVFEALRHGKKLKKLNLLARDKLEMENISE